MVYIDVRTDEEYNEKHKPGAIHHNIELMMDGKFPDLEKDTPVVLYCRSGGRAGRAKTLMQNAGFTNVTNGGGLDDVI